MKIKDLPINLRELALDSQLKQHGSFGENERIIAAFNWLDTPEGWGFWANVWLNYDQPTIEEQQTTIEESEKPTQYKIGIDTFERAKANLTKEELLACCRFNIDKYTWRKKDQDKSDFEKIIAYATYAIENGF